MEWKKAWEHRTYSGAICSNVKYWFSENEIYFMYLHRSKFDSVTLVKNTKI
jgi:hypothetical protein